MKSSLHGMSPMSPHEPLRAALAKRGGVIRVEIPGELPYWLVAGQTQKRELVDRGAPPGRVWTVCELESFPWDEPPITLSRCLAAFQSPAPPERVPDTTHA